MKTTPTIQPIAIVPFAVVAATLIGGVGLVATKPTFLQQLVPQSVKTTETLTTQTINIAESSKNLTQTLSTTAVGSTITLENMARFDWDEVCLFTAGTTKNSINSKLDKPHLVTLGVWVPTSKPESYVVPEDTTLIMFFKENVGLAATELPANQITTSFPPSTPQCVLKNAAIFTAKKSTDDSQSTTAWPNTPQPSPSIKRNPTTSQPKLPASAKPVIYLYPTTGQKIKVQLTTKEPLTASYPTYNQALQGWEVWAEPDGTLTDQTDQQQYSYLFWEATNTQQYHPQSGYVVAGKDTKAFLQKTLAAMGLTPKEYNEFIVYWYPRLANHPYNLISFAGDEYTQTAPLAITPQPDSLLRVYMVYQPLEAPISIPTPTITPFVRKGFTVVEWGGLELP